MIDLDAGVMEWRQADGRSPGAKYFATTLLRSAFPDLWPVRTEL